ncbi:hypothetical protein ACFLRN_09300 [Thermoproteota archaeon]
MKKLRKKLSEKELKADATLENKIAKENTNKKTPHNKSMSTGD